MLDSSITFLQMTMFMSLDAMQANDTQGLRMVSILSEGLILNLVVISDKLGELMDIESNQFNTERERLNKLFQSQDENPDIH